MRRRSALNLIVTALILAVTPLAGCGPAAGAPPTDSCVAPSDGTIDTLELGTATATDLAGGATTFAPLHDGDGVMLVGGSQGANMLGFKLRVSGASAPSCLAQATTITDTAGNRITGAKPPLATYEQPDGTRLTKALWLPGEYPLSFIVGVTAANQSLAVQLHLRLTP